jgi:hypothetical protein
MPLTETNEWRIMNCTFSKMESNQSLDLIYIYDYRGKATICNNEFSENKVLHGGVLRFATGDRLPQVLVEENIFYSNTGLHGGAIYFEEGILPGIKNNYFVDNTAMLYGQTFAGGSEKLVVFQKEPLQPRGRLTNKIKLLSGDTFPSFSVVVQDVFWQTIVPSDFTTNFLVAYASVVNQVEGDSTPKATTVSGFEKVMLQDQDAATFDELQVVGLPGDYTLLILPRINFDPLRINARLNFTLSDCELPRVQQTIGKEAYPRCIERERLFPPLYICNLTLFMICSFLHQRL